MKAIKVGDGCPCPKCGRPMERREHAPGWVPQPGRYWFRAWDWCSACSHVQHYESQKVYPGQTRERTPPPMGTTAEQNRLFHAVLQQLGEDPGNLNNDDHPPWE